MKPLRFDAKTSTAFPNVMLLDAGGDPVPLRVASPFEAERSRDVKNRAVKASEKEGWLWQTDAPIPPLPVAASMKGRAQALP